MRLDREAQAVWRGRQETGAESSAEDSVRSALSKSSAVRSPWFRRHEIPAGAQVSTVTVDGTVHCQKRRASQASHHRLS